MDTSTSSISNDGHLSSNSDDEDDEDNVEICVDDDDRRSASGLQSDVEDDDNDDQGVKEETSTNDRVCPETLDQNKRDLSLSDLVHHSVRRDDNTRENYDISPNFKSNECDKTDDCSILGFHHSETSINHVDSWNSVPKKVVLKHSAESMITRDTTHVSHRRSVHKTNCDPNFLKNSHEQAGGAERDADKPYNEGSKVQESPFSRRLEESLQIENQHRRLRLSPDNANNQHSSGPGGRSSVYSPDGYCADSESDTATKKNSCVNIDPCRPSYLSLPNQHNPYIRDRSFSRHEEHLKQQFHFHNLLTIESEKRDLFEKENRFLQEQKTLCKDSRSPPNVTVCQRSPIAHSLFPVCHSNLFGTNTSAFHHPMTSLYINTFTSQPHVVPHIPPSSLSSLASSMPHMSSSASPPNRSPTRSPSSSFLSSLSNPHLPHYLPTSHPAAVARAIAASTLPLSQHLAFIPRNAGSLNHLFQARSQPSRYHPYAPNAVSPGVPSSPEGCHTRSNTPSPASSPTIKTSPTAVIKPLPISREMGLNLTTTENRIVPV